MNFLCPSCRTPLPRAPIEQVTCSGCGVQVDLTRAETAPGQARLWPEVDLSGETLGGFVLERLLGSGGMGTVYEARAPDGAKVALKVLAPLLAAEPELRERFRREARALTAITHPGVVKMLSEGEERSFCWYAMELVTGPDLKTRLKSGPLKPEEVRSLARSMLQALQAVHAAGFVHRDLKPANVLLSANGPKLCDFGIARVDDAPTLTASAAVMGSLRYMSPEQRWGRSDQRSDLYGLGVVLHEALALGVPGEKSLPASTPRSITRLIDVLTANAPDRRPQSATEALKLLDRAPSRALIAAAIVASSAALAIAAFVLNPVSANALPEEVDAGATLAATTIIDAGARLPIELEAGAADAGFDAGTEDAGIDAGVGEPDVLVATKGDPPPPKPKPFGKPVGKKKKEPEPEVKSAAVPEGEQLPAKVGVEGTGTGRVLVRGVEIGKAPGTFEVEPGGFLLQVECDGYVSSGKTMKHPVVSFKASAKRGKTSVYRYTCPTNPFDG
ncbi:MAG: serine/threonine protein kinase [Archangium sp.]|nr:serine/threonine protein kinase [Archangium sp.]